MLTISIILFYFCCYYSYCHIESSAKVRRASEPAKFSKKLSPNVPRKRWHGGQHSFKSNAKLHLCQHLPIVLNPDGADWRCKTVPSMPVHEVIPMQRYTSYAYHKHTMRQLAPICPLKLRIQSNPLTQIRGEITQSWCSRQIFQANWPPWPL